MLRKIEIVPTLLAMLIVLFTTFVPHHHHQAMICLVKEVCVMDGCCDDEHTMHSDANHEEDESHCVSHEKYCPSDNLRLDFPQEPVIVSSILLVPSACLSGNSVLRPAFFKDLAAPPPPILTWRINC